MRNQLRVGLAGLRRALTVLDAALAEENARHPRTATTAIRASARSSCPTRAPSTIHTDILTSADPTPISFTPADTLGAVALANWLATDPHVPPSSLTYRRHTKDFFSFSESLARAIQYHSDDNNRAASFLAQASNLTLTEKEKIVANAVAQRLGLPRRFQWPVSASLHASLSNLGIRLSRGGVKAAEKSTAVSPTAIPSPPPPVAANASHFLWGTAVRTSDGARALPRTAGVTAVGPPDLADPTAIFLSSPSQHLASTPAKGKAAVEAAATVTSAQAMLGGGVLHASVLESYLCLLHTARTQALTRALAASGGFATPSQEEQHRQAQRLVMYCSDQVDPTLRTAAELLGMMHVRVLRTVLWPIASPSSADAKETANSGSQYVLDATEVKRQIVEDLAAGRYPCLVVGVFGSALSGAVDPLTALASFCHKTGVWLHIDASHGSSALLADSALHTADRNHDTDAGCVENRIRGRGTLGDSLSTIRHQFAQELRTAAALADSILCTATAMNTGLPYSPLPVQSLTTLGAFGVGNTPLHFLFLAHTAKLQAALRARGSAEVMSTSCTLTPTVEQSAPDSLLMHGARGALSASAFLHLSRIDEDCGRVAILDAAAAALMPETAVCTTDAYVKRENPPMSGDTAAAVRVHQRVLHRVQTALQADGRLDCVLTAAPIFGRVYVRLLTQADEVTAAFAAQVADAVKRDSRRSLFPSAEPSREVADASVTAMAAPAVAERPAFAEPPAVRLYVSLVLLQRRAWVCLSMGRVEADDDATVTYVVETVRHAVNSVLTPA